MTKPKFYDEEQQKKTARKEYENHKVAFFVLNSRHLEEMYLKNLTSVYNF